MAYCRRAVQAKLMHNNRRYPQKLMFTATGGPTDLPPVALGYSVGVIGQYHATRNCQSTLKSHGHSEIAGILCSSHILASELFSYHCKRSSYLCDN